MTDIAQILKISTEDIYNLSIDFNKKYITGLKNFLVKKDIKYLVYFDKNYPRFLKEIFDPPLVLFYKGNIDLVKKPSLAMIGSRKASTYGLKIAGQFSRQLAQKGINIISGLAYGIDNQAHLGALEVNGLTTAVIGNGIDIIYPSGNYKTLRKITKKGLLISEYWPGTLPLKYHFPARNRIIAGLSQAVLVVEAAEKSGALITVDFALDYGKDVMAVPGSIFSKLSTGTNRLIKLGALPVTNVNDILEYFDIKIENKINNEPVLAGIEKKVFQNIDFEKKSFQDIQAKLFLEPSLILQVLTKLELMGLVKKLAGNYYIRS